MQFLEEISWNLRGFREFNGLSWGKSFGLERKGRHEPRRTQRFLSNIIN